MMKLLLNFSRSAVLSVIVVILLLCVLGRATAGDWIFSISCSGTDDLYWQNQRTLQIYHYLQPWTCLYNPGISPFMSDVSGETIYGQYLDNIGGPVFSVSASGSLTTTMSWSPSSSADIRPTKVIVQESSYASGSLQMGTNVINTFQKPQDLNPSLSADDGLGDSAITSLIPGGTFGGTWYGPTLQKESSIWHLVEVDFASTEATKQFKHELSASADIDPIVTPNWSYNWGPGCSTAVHYAITTVGVIIALGDWHNDSVVPGQHNMTLSGLVGHPNDSLFTGSPYWQWSFKDVQYSSDNQTWGAPPSGATCSFTISQNGTSLATLQEIDNTNLPGYWRCTVEADATYHGNDGDVTGNAFAQPQSPADKVVTQAFTDIEGYEGASSGGGNHPNAVMLAPHDGTPQDRLKDRPLLSLDTPLDPGSLLASGTRVLMNDWGVLHVYGEPPVEPVITEQIQQIIINGKTTTLADHKFKVPLPPEIVSGNMNLVFSTSKFADNTSFELIHTVVTDPPVFSHRDVYPGMVYNKGLSLYNRVGFEAKYAANLAEEGIFADDAFRLTNNAPKLFDDWGHSDLNENLWQYTVFYIGTHGLVDKTDHIGNIILMDCKNYPFWAKSYNDPDIEKTVETMLTFKKEIGGSNNIAPPFNFTFADACFGAATAQLAEAFDVDGWKGAGFLGWPSEGYLGGIDQTTLRKLFWDGFKTGSTLSKAAAYAWKNTIKVYGPFHVITVEWDPASGTFKQKTIYTEKWKTYGDPDTKITNLYQESNKTIWHKQLTPP